MTADFSYSLEALERRWQVEKTPQVGLRLAEEYRRKGDLEASIQALAAGLEVYPNHTSSRVALSRYLVDGGRFSEAVAHLEQIVSLDPAHLVANKLLVGAYAGVGRIEDARDKLAIYEMMGEGDADIERLHTLLNEARETTASPSEPPIVEPKPEILEPGIETGGRTRAGSIGAVETGGGVLASGTRGITPDSDLFAEAPPGSAEEDPDPFRISPATSPAPLAPLAPETPEPAVRVGATETSRETSDEPFGDAFGEVPSSSYWQGVADEGIFVLETPAEAVRAESSPVLAEGDRAEPSDRPTPLDVDELPDTSKASNGVETANADADSASPASSAGGASGAGAMAGSTVTLGKLYREQGHPEEAAEAFEEVLAREPENETARRELEAVTGTEPEVKSDSPATLADRRRAVLTTYRERLRRTIAAGI